MGIAGAPPEVRPLIELSWLPFGHALCPGEVCTAEFARGEFLTDVMIGKDAELLSVAGDVVIHRKGDGCI